MIDHMYGKAMDKMGIEDYARLKSKSQLADIAYRFMKNKTAVLGLILFLLILLFGLFAGQFGTYEESVTVDIMNKLKPFSSEHWFGTDTYGRDLLLRCAYGARISLYIGIAAALLASVVGTFFGMIAAYRGGIKDSLIMRVFDVLSAIPSTLFAICIVAALGSGNLSMIFALAVTRIAACARIARASVLGISGQEYIEAARAGGVGDFRILLLHILPNMVGPILVQTTTNVAQVILAIASLSFIGLGVPAPTPEWGAMITEARAVMRLYPHMILVPGLFILFTALSINLIGDGLRDALDPRLRN